MILPNFEYLAPGSLEEALDLLHQHKDENMKILAGGTDLLVDVRQKVIPDGHRPRCQQHRSGAWKARKSHSGHPEKLLSITRLKELRHITIDDDRIRIGALATITDLERSDVVKKNLPGLWDGAYQLGSPLVRNRGTFGGNICNARPAADTAIPTLALGGVITAASKSGVREIEHDDLVTAPGETILKDDELVTEITFDQPEKGLTQKSSYMKLANRKSLEISVVGAASAVTFDEDGVVISARIALGAVAPKPLLIPMSGEALIGSRLEAKIISEAARIAAEIAAPITDHRSTLEYRKLMVEVLVRRSLNQCQYSTEPEAVEMQ